MNPKFEELKVSGVLPSPCRVGIAILNLTESEDFSTDELVAMIQTDPALTGQLLKMANSSYTAGIAPITTIDEATMRIGSQAVRNVALSFSLMSGNRAGTCVPFDYDTFWARSVFTGVAAQSLAKDANLVSSAEAFVCGLLCNIGALALASVHPEAYGALVSQSGGRYGSVLLHAERLEFEITRHEVSQAMLLDWGFPDTAAVAVAGHTDRRKDPAIDDLPAVLWAGAILARFYVAASAERVATLCEFDQVKDAMGLPDDEFFVRCESIVAEWHQMGRMIDVPTPEASEMREMYLRARSVARTRPASTAVDQQALERGRGDEPAPTPESPTDQVDIEDSARVLVIEDDRLCRQVLVEELKRLGHEVRSAPEGRSGLKIAIEWNPHIVITDWVMPEMDGIELCRALRRCETGREMYLIILTGNDEEEQIVHAFHAGADDYVLKPFRPRLLAARLRAAMRVVKLQGRVAIDRAKMQQQVAKLGVLTRRLHQATLSDSLTGLPNRRFAMDHLEEEWERARKDGTPLAVIMADIDRFKLVNDEHGHDAGDFVLKEVGRVLCTTLRGNEKVCRMGGEEFLVIVSDTDLKGATGCAERLRKVLEAHVIKWNEFHRAVTVSMGVAEMRPYMAGSFDLVKLADLGAYAAKEAGRNCVRSEQSQPARV